MKKENFKLKNIDELNTRLLSLLREQCNLNIQAATGLLRKTHLLKQARRNVARIKTLLNKKMYS